MNFNYGAPGEPRIIPLHAAVLAGVFGALIAGLICLGWSPGLLQSVWGASLSLIAVESLATVLYGVWAYGRKWPFAVHLGVHWLLNTLVLNLWGLADGGSGWYFNPVQWLHVYPAQLAIMATTWIIALILADSVTRIQQMLHNVSRQVEHQRLQEKTHSYQLGEGVVLDEAEKINLLPNQTEWRSLRFKIAALLTVGLFSLICRPEKGVVLTPFFPGAVLGLAVIGGILLLTRGYFDTQRAVWQSEGLEPEATMAGLWQHWTLGLFLAALLLTAWIPAFPPVGSYWGERLVHSMENQPNFTQQPQGNETAPGQRDESLPAQEPKANAASVVYLLLLLAIYYGTLGLLIGGGVILAGYLLYRFGTAEQQKWRGLPGLIVGCYLGWREFWRKLRSRLQVKGRRTAKTTDQAAIPAIREQRKPARDVWGSGVRAQIRRGYVGLFKQAQGRGVTWQASHTPAELANCLAGALPEEGQAVSELTEAYYRARYGPTEPAVEQVKTFEQLRQEVARRLEALKQERGSSKE